MKKLTALLLACGMVLTLAACGGKDAPQPSQQPGAQQSGAPAADGGPKTGGTLRVGLNSAPVSANIWYQNDLNSATIMNLVCPNTVTMDDSGTKYNYLVESAQANDDCTEWTVTLKEGLCWNDGTPVSADDLLFTGKYGTSHHIGFFDSYYGLVDYDKSQVVDERTVKFVLTSGNVNFWNGAGYWIPIMRQSE